MLPRSLAFVPLLIALVATSTPALAQDDAQRTAVFDVPAEAWGAFQADNDLWKLDTRAERALAERAARLLRDSTDAGVLERALWVLARVGGYRSHYVADLVRLIEGTDTPVRAPALATAATLSGPENTALLRALGEPRAITPPEFAELVLRAAAEAGDAERWLRPLLAGAGDPADATSPQIRLVLASGVRSEETRLYLEKCVRRADTAPAALAAEALGQFGAAAVPALRSALEMPFPELVGGAAAGLAQVGPAGAPALSRLMAIVSAMPLHSPDASFAPVKEPDVAAALAAARALRHLGVLDADLCRLLIEQIRRGGSQMQAECVWTAGWIGCGDDAALAAMQAMAADGGLNPGLSPAPDNADPGATSAELRWMSRRAAWMLLLRRDGPEAMRRDMARFIDQHRPIHPRALDDVVEGEGAEAIVPALAGLLDAGTGAEAAIAAALGRLGPRARQALPALLDAASRCNPGSSAAAALEAVARIGPAPVQSATLLRRLRWSANSSVSGAARRVLRDSGLE